ncbi:conserved hypothetical protein [Leptospira interrogans serovar Manilae]|uniref:Uncharacterized protein n=1 Tax=Leptospira interrogans serovar Manilae TaxID=214675 RepID=A0AAQ1SP02_LEPIR|nr:conserved hypothetical protein [Leptospira interrogans serovar Manilae]
MLRFSINFHIIILIKYSIYKIIYFLNILFFLCTFLKFVILCLGRILSYGLLKLLVFDLAKVNLKIGLEGEIEWKILSG